MINIKILSAETKSISGVSKSTGKPYSFKTQQGYVLTYDSRTGKPNPFPEKIEMTLEDTQPAYPIGDYTLSPLSFYVNRNQRLELSPKLMPIQK